MNYYFSWRDKACEAALLYSLTAAEHFAILWKRRAVSLAPNQSVSSFEIISLTPEYFICLQFTYNKIPYNRKHFNVPKNPVSHL